MANFIISQQRDALSAPNCLTAESTPHSVIVYCRSGQISAEKERLFPDAPIDKLFHFRFRRFHPLHIPKSKTVAYQLNGISTC